MLFPTVGSVNAANSICCFSPYFRFRSSLTKEYNGRTHFFKQTSSIGPVLSICKLYRCDIMEIFVMLNENDISSLSFWNS